MMNRYTFIFLLISMLFLLYQSGKGQSFEEKKIEFIFSVNASPEEVYDAWTTEEGIKSFFAPDGNVELKKYGDYQIFFFPDSAEGKRGAEDEVVLAYEENKMFLFTWGFPRSLPKLRATQKTVVLLRFSEIGNGKTRVHFLQTGWGSVGNWKKGFEYFVHNFGNLVLARLQYRFDHGPIDWDNIPRASKYQLVD